MSAVVYNRYPLYIFSLTYERLMREKYGKGEKRSQVTYRYP